MNLKQLLILGLVLAVLGGAALMLVKKDAATRQGGGRSAGGELLADLPVGEELAQLSIRQGTNTLTLLKVDGVWAVAERGNYPANYAEISRTVLQLRDLKPAQTEQVSGAHLGRLELLEPGAPAGGGTVIEFRDTAGQPLASLLLGKQQTTLQDAPASQFGPGGPREVPIGRWVMDPADPTVAALVSEVLSHIQPTPGPWLNKDFFKVEKIKSIEVRYPDQVTNSFRLSRENESGEWALAGLDPGLELDATKTSGFNYAFGSPSFEDVVLDAATTELGLDSPTRIMIETFNGFDYDITSGRTVDGKLPIRVAVQGVYPRERVADEGEEASVKAQRDKVFSDALTLLDEKLKNEQALEPWTFLVSSWTLDPVLKKRGDLLKEKEAAESAAGAEAGVSPLEGLLDLPVSE